MTTKEIAQAVGKDERSVQRWIKSICDKMASIGDKMASSSPVYPADYTIAEVCAIIEAGMGADVAGAFRDNAVNKELQSKQESKQKTQYSASYIREVRLSLGKEAAAALLIGNTQVNKTSLQVTDGSERLPEHIARQVYAVAVKAFEKENAKQELKKHKTLFDGKQA